MNPTREQIDALIAERNLHEHTYSGKRRDTTPSDEGEKNIDFVAV